MLSEAGNPVMSGTMENAWEGEESFGDSQMDCDVFCETREVEYCSPDRDGLSTELG